MERANSKLAVRGLALLAMLAPPAVFAQTSTATMAVSATVLKVCISAVTPMAFGNYTASSGTPNDTTATITITCTNGTTYVVSLDAGTTSGATTSARKMAFSSARLNYELDQDSGHSQNWGNNSGTDTVAGTGNGSAQTLTVYGRIAISQYVTVGAYTDTVTVTVTY